MCIGTKCTHHINDAVSFVERDYDSWVMFDDAEEAQSEDRDYVYVSVLNRHVLPSYEETHGPSFCGTMLSIKEDMPLNMDPPSVYYRCTDCKAEGGFGHWCHVCGTEVTHMAHGTCIACAQLTDKARITRVRERQAKLMRGPTPTMYIYDEVLGPMEVAGNEDTATGT